MTNKVALTIIVSIILTVILISLVNVGTSILIDEPQYNDYCSPAVPGYDITKTTQEEQAAIDERATQCLNEYEDALKPYNQYRYYIFAGIGFILLLVGLFFKENIVQLVGLASGGILVAEGIVINLQNKAIVFFSLLAILIIFGIVAWRVINKK